jgi:hypothetical protein
MTLFDSNLQQQDEGSVARGFFVGGGINLIFTVAGLATGMTLAHSGRGMLHVIGVILNNAVGAISVLQLAYLYPMYRHYRKTGARDTAKGLLIAAAVTALLSATCWAVLLANLEKF